MDKLLHTVLPYVFCTYAAYLAGSVNFAWLFAHKKGFDIRTKGSGNAGTTNAGRTMGLAAAVAVFVLDVIKSAAVVFMAGFLFPESVAIQTAAIAGCVCGHLYPYYLDFRGGKGVAVLLGSSLALDWRLFALLLVGIGVIIFLTDYMFIATLTAAVAYWLWFYLTGKSLPDVIILFFVIALIFWKHKSNFARFFAGKELGIRATVLKKKAAGPQSGDQ